MNVNAAGADWILIRKWITENIEVMRNNLEQSDLAFEATQFQRGRIAALRELLAHVEPTKTPETEDVNYG